MNLSAHQLTMTMPSFLSTTPDERRRHEATCLRKQLRQEMEQRFNATKHGPAPTA